MNSNIIVLHDTKNKKAAVIYEEAIQWIVEMDLGLSEQRQVELQQWMRQSEQHKTTLFEQAKLWDELNILGKLSEIFPAEKPQKQTKYYLVAASILLIFLTGMLVKGVWRENDYLTPAHTDSQLYAQNYFTQKGDVETYILPDGSKLTLNTDSSTNISFNKDRRNIFLQHGEVFIEVAKDKNRPLNIIVGDKVIQAVGTAFNVQYFTNQMIEVVVSEGKVMFAEESILQQNINFSEHFPQSKGALLLTAGDKVVSKKDQAITNELVVEKIFDNLDKSLSWLDGHLSFAGESMEVAIEKVNRYLPQPIILKGEEIKQIRVIGRFENGALEPFLQGLSANFKIDRQTTPEGQIILSLQH